LSKASARYFGDNYLFIKDFDIEDEVSANKLLPTELPGGTPKSESQRAATDGFLEYLPLPGTESVRIFQSSSPCSDGIFIRA
jgi:hypothetical protein